MATIDIQLKLKNADELAIFVVLVVPCSKWGSACRLRYLFHLKLFFKSVIREKEKEKGKERERERERGFCELGNCFCERLFFLLLAPESALKKIAASANPENKITKVNWTLSWPSALEICGESVL